MDIKCACCNNVYVEHEGDVCFNCMLKGATRKNDAFSNNTPDITPDSQEIVPGGKKNKRPARKEKERPERTSGRTTVRGTVYDFKKEPDTRGTMERYTSSLFKGTPYTSSEEKFIFNVKDDTVRSLDFGSRTGTCVVINGSYTFGSITNNDVVEVRGTRNKYGVVAAEQIINISNGSRITIQKQISAAVIRGITLFAVCVVAFLINLLLGGIGPMVDGDLGNASAGTASGIAWKGDIPLIIVGVLLFAFAVKFGRMFSTSVRTAMMAVAAGIILYVIDESLLMSVLCSGLIIYVLVQMLKKLFR